MRTCENCKVQYDGSYGSGRFCTSKCARGFSTKNKRNEINEKISKTLTGKGNGPVDLTCSYCNKPFTISWRKRHQKYCSRSCSGKDLPIESRIRISNKMKVINSGENNPMFGKSPKNVKRIKVYSEKHLGDKEFYVRSSYEVSYVELLNNDSNVKSFKYEPIEYKTLYIQNGKNRTYQPDFYVTENQKEYVTEVKAEWQKNSEESLTKKNAFLKMHNIEYKFWPK